MLFIPHIRYQLKNWLGFPKHSSFARFVVYHLNSRHLYVRSSNGSFNQVYGIQISAVLVLSNFSHKLTPIISSGNFELLAVVKTSFIVSVVFHLSFRLVVMTIWYWCSGNKFDTLNGGTIDDWYLPTFDDKMSTLFVELSNSSSNVEFVSSIEM